MVKLRSAETLSLDKNEQKKVSKRTKVLKKKIKEGKITVKEKKVVKKSSLDKIKRKKGAKKEAKAPIKKDKKKEENDRKVLIKERKKAKAIERAQKRGLIYIGHIPHGFYENEMKKYFKQFGTVTNVKVCRSGRTGNSKGYGYVEFAHPDVAKIAAETMNNYLMFKKRIVAEYVPYEKRPKGLFSTKRNTPKTHSVKVRREKQMDVNTKLDSKTHLRRSKSRLSHLNKKLQKLQKMGINYDLKLVDVPEGLNIGKSNSSDSKNSDIQNDTHTYQTDPYDSDIEVKIPLKKSKKSIKSLGSINTKKSKNVEQSPSKKLLLAKSLDSVKTLISSKTSDKSSNLKSSTSLKKLTKATFADIKIKKKKTITKSKGITKKKVKKELPLNADTVKKIARELIRKRGDSLLNVVTTPKKKKPSKKK